MSYWRRFDILFSTIGYSDKRLFDDRIQFVTKYAIEVIEARRKILLQTNIDKYSDENDQDKSNGMCFIDVLLQSAIDGLPLTNEEILDEVQTFMIAVSVSKTNKQKTH